MTTQVLNNVEIVHHNIRVWTGKKKLEASDLDRVDSGDLPSADVASLGLKRLIDSRHLTVFNTIRHHADRASREAGVRFLGAYAVPQEAISPLMARLEELRLQFEAEVRTFLDLYDERVEDWANQHPDFRTQILRAKVPRDEVKARFNASFAVYRVIASERDQGASMAAESAGLYDSLLEALVDDLSDYVKRSRTSVCDGFRVNVRHSVRDVAEKLRRFRFLDDSGGLSFLANELEQAVAGEGKIQEADFRRFKAVITDLGSVDGVKTRIAELIGQGGVSSRAPLDPTLLCQPPRATHVPAPLAPESTGATIPAEPTASTEPSTPAEPSASAEPTPRPSAADPVSPSEGETNRERGEDLTLDTLSGATRRPSLSSLNW